MRCLCLMILLLGSTPAFAEEAGSFARNITRVSKPDGKITDTTLINNTGWDKLRAFTVTMELEEGGKFKKVSSQQVFRNGDRFRLRINSSSDLYISVLVVNSDKSVALLVPQENEAIPLIKRDATRLIPPDDSAFSFSPPAGTETLMLIASPVQLPWTTAREYQQLKNGREVSLRIDGRLTKLKAVSTTGPATDNTIQREESVRKATDKLKSGTLSKNIQIVGVNRNNNEEFVFNATPKNQQSTILLHELRLKHE